jgi:hypothetical protein
MDCSGAPDTWGGDAAGCHETLPVQDGPRRASSQRRVAPADVTPPRSYQAAPQPVCR